MNSFLVLLVLCALLALSAVCASHAESPLDVTAHGLGCPAAAILSWLVATLPILALTGRLGLPASGARPPSPPLAIFQPPD